MKIFITLIPICVLGCFLNSAAFVGQAAAKGPDKKSKTKSLKNLERNCGKSSLERRNCDLSLDPYKISLTSDRITISQGAWKSVHDLPLVQEGTQWESVRLRNLGTRWLVEFEFWTPPTGEVQVQDLYWIVFELDKVQWSEKIREVVQKGRVKASVATKSQGHRDIKSKFGLKKADNGSIHWWAGRLKGDF